MSAAKSIFGALLLVEFLLGACAVWSQNNRIPAFAVSYSRRTTTQVSGVVAVQHAAPESQLRRGLRPVAQFTVPAAAADQKLTLQIYDLLGRMILQEPVHTQHVKWQGYDRQYRPLASGLYLFRIRAEQAPAFIQQHAGSRLFEDATATALPEDTSQTRDAQIGDLDGDGDLDVFLAHNTNLYGRQPQILINNGKGIFRDETSARLPVISILNNQIEFVDVDQDGDLDIYLANAIRDLGNPSDDKLLINDGAGHFQDETSARISQTWSMTEGVAAGDIDGDGDADLLAATLFEGARVLVNNGEGFFADSTAQRLDASVYGALDVSLADVNRDQRLDIMLADVQMVITDENGNVLDSLSGQEAIFINQGNGYFRDETSSRNPVVVQDVTTEIAVGDVDRDGDMDLFLNNVGFSGEENLNRLLINNGQGFFADESAMRLPEETVAWNNDADFADFNGDGVLDLFMPSVNPDAGGNSQDLLYVNDGAGHFRDQSSVDLPEVVDFSAAAATGDLDGDTDVEILIANIPPRVGGGLSAQNRLYQNQNIATAVHEPGYDSHPSFFQLFASHPNPAHAFAMIRYYLPAAQSIQLQVYDLNGRLVRALVDREQPAGDYAVRWDGRNEAGAAAPPGIYFYRLVAGGKTVATRKLMILGEIEL